MDMGVGWCVCAVAQTMTMTGCLQSTYSLPSGDWSHIQGTRAFTVLSILLGFAGLALTIVSYVKQSLDNLATPAVYLHMIAGRCWSV